MGLANAKDQYKVLLLFANDQSVCLQLFTTKAQSLLLMTSVAMPVFSKKKETVCVTHEHMGRNPLICYQITSLDHLIR